jgi:MFS transporter, DHA1 family, tetracycline resistance protein
VLVSTSFVVALGYGVVAPALPIFARSFDVGVTAVSFVASAFAVVRLAFGPLSGRLVNQLGESRVFACGLIVVAASSAACAFVTTYWELLICRAIGGAGSTLFTVSAASLLIRLAPPSMRGRAAGAWATAFLLGTVAGPLVGGALVAVGLRTPFIAYAGLLLLAVVISRGVLDERAGRRSDPGPPTHGVVTFPAAWRQPAFRAALTSNFVHGWIVYGVQVTLVPLYIVEVLARPASWSGSALTLSAAGTALTLALGGRMADERGRTVSVRTGLTITVVGTVGLAFTSALPAFLGASLLVGVGTGLTYPATNATVGDVLSTRSPAGGHAGALAGFQMVGDIGAIVGPLLAGLAADAVGYTAAFVLTATVAAVSLGCWQRTPETRPLTPA